MKNIDKYCLFETNTTNEAIEKIITNSDNERLVFIVNKELQNIGHSK